ncbi:hypothetical protein [Streptomyces albidochromogenes]|uniref:DUF222 domain-containing protein n=1 Tax=Streptomyces albidochromogenes TaxID=329524 RepID=A0ABW6FJ29_9ACTN
MTEAASERRIMLADVPRLTAEELVACFDEDFRNLVTVSIADATRRLSRPVRQLLRGPEWHQDWQDALLWAEGELQVSAERMRLTGDGRAEGVETKLRRVRANLHEARRVSAQYRREAVECSPEHLSTLNAQHTALSWLAKAFPADYSRLVEQSKRERGIVDPPPRPPAQDVFDSVEEACERGWLKVTMTPPVARLLRQGQVSFRGVVADDARHQNERNVLLRHPLAVRRWKAALTELTEMTTSPAKASSHTALGPLNVDLSGLPHDHAMQIINARRFYCAVQQRHLECDRVVRHLMQTVATRKDHAPETHARREAGEQADRTLAAQHPHAYAHIRNALHPYEAAPGQLDPALLPANARGALKSRLIKEAQQLVPEKDRSPAA